MLRNLDEDTVGIIVISIGIMLTIGVNLTPTLLFYRYFKKKARLEIIPETMFITGIFSCATSLAYSIHIISTLISTKILVICNCICYGLQVLYGSIYIFIKTSKNIGKFLFI